MARSTTQQSARVGPATAAGKRAGVLDTDALLDDPTTGIIVCCGSGGVGKTTTSAALALRAAERAGACCAVFVGAQELATGTVVVRNMATGEQVDDEAHWRTVVNFVASYQVSSNFTLLLDSIYGYQAGAPLDWRSVAGYLDRLEQELATCFGRWEELEALR